MGSANALEDAASIEKSTAQVTLKINEETSVAYVAGWLEMKCRGEVSFSNEEPLVTSGEEDFINTVSRGSLTTPHQCTFELVRCGLCFMKVARHRGMLPEQTGGHPHNSGHVQ